MMHGERYCLSKPTAAVDRQNKLCFVLPARSVIELSNLILDDESTVCVKHEGQELTMFAQDIRDRGSPLEDAVGNEPETKSKSKTAGAL